ncbi:energy transducer TonB family protein [Solimonas flava]|uniref:energy transducer TonB family protein n=1 Tax=Solimonas flava TaxID=415849 RepID=UPI000408DF53|nr:energy transducer TonB [Solimonas flava]
MNRASAPRLTRYAGYGFGALVVIALIGSCVYLLGRGSAVPRKAEPQVVQMRVIELPPPPPPPPPPETRMVEEKPQPQFTEQAPQEQTTPQPSDEPPGPPALDVQGQGAADGFGLAGRPGGGDFVGGGGGGGSRFGWYSALLQGRISQALQKQRRLYDARWEIPALIWLDETGAVQRVELLESSGKPEIDRLIVSTIEAMPQLPQPPPKDMPQPIATRISAS